MAYVSGSTSRPKRISANKQEKSMMPLKIDSIDGLNERSRFAQSLEVVLDDILDKFSLTTKMKYVQEMKP